MEDDSLPSLAPGWELWWELTRSLSSLGLLEEWGEVNLFRPSGSWGGWMVEMRCGSDAVFRLSFLLKGLVLDGGVHNSCWV